MIVQRGEIVSGGVFGATRKCSHVHRDASERDKYLVKEQPDERETEHGDHGAGGDHNSREPADFPPFIREGTQDLALVHREQAVARRDCLEIGLIELAEIGLDGRPGITRVVEGYDLVTPCRVAIEGVMNLPNENAVLLIAARCF
ncbi:MAG TPA: hypothetical protein VII85_00110, partial [Candidatus Krumholzibacteriaceae bacterium]